MSAETHSAPQHDSRLERAVLATMVEDRHGLTVALPLLKAGAEVFYSRPHQLLFQAITHLQADGQAVDALSVGQQLQATGYLQTVTASVDLHGLHTYATTPERVQTHCLLLLELFAKRRVGLVARRLLEAAADPTQDCFDLLTEAQTGLTKLHQHLSLKQAQRLPDLIDPALEQIRLAAESTGGLTGVPSGLASLDRITGGWQPSDLIILAARPAMGKTALAAFMARYAATDNHYPGLFFSLEMSTLQLVRRLIATETGYSNAQLKGGHFSNPDQQMAFIEQKVQVLRRSGLLFDDTAGLSIGEFQSKVAQAVADHGIRFVVVDYLQLMKGEKGGNREQEIGSISRGLKLCAKEHNIPVIALAQLSRGVEARGGDNKPKLSDLRESGSIEQDADMVVFPYRPEYYKITQDEMGNPTANTTEIIIAKHRNGPVDSVLVGSQMHLGRYYDLDDTPLATPMVPAAAEFTPAPGGIRTATPSEFDGTAPF